jgi:primosomal protein N'
MNYYFVWVRSNRYHGKEALTYSSADRLITGSIVEVELQKELVMGVVTGPAGQPRFKTKAVSSVFKLPPLPAYLLKLVAWLPTYYPAPVGIITQQLLPGSFSAKQLAAPATQEFPEPDLSGLPPLTQEQKTALAAMTEHDTYLLHGTTGSGKTRLYI